MAQAAGIYALLSAGEALPAPSEQQDESESANTATNRERKRRGRPLTNVLRAVADVSSYQRDEQVTSTADQSFTLADGQRSTSTDDASFTLGDKSRNTTDGKQKDEEEDPLSFRLDDDRDVGGDGDGVTREKPATNDDTAAASSSDPSPVTTKDADDGDASPPDSKANAVKEKEDDEEMKNPKKEPRDHEVKETRKSPREDGDGAAAAAGPEEQREDDKTTQRRVKVVEDEDDAKDTTTRNKEEEDASPSSSPRSSQQQQQQQQPSSTSSSSSIISRRRGATSPEPIKASEEQNDTDNVSASASPPRSSPQRSPSGRHSPPQSPAGSPRTKAVDRIRRQRAYAADGAVVPVTPLKTRAACPNLVFVFHVANQVQFDGSEARSAKRPQLLHGLRCLKAAATAAATKRPEQKRASVSPTRTRPAWGSASASQTAPARTSSGNQPTKQQRQQRRAAAGPMTPAEGRAWDTALTGFEAMRAKPASAAAVHPAVTFLAVVLPIAVPSTPEHHGLTALWNAARANCKPKKKAMREAEARRALEAARETVETPLPVRFRVQAPLSLPLTPYSSVPWLELLAHAAEDGEEAQTLQQVVRATERRRPNRAMRVAALRDLFDLTTKRQPGEEGDAKDGTRGRSTGAANNNSSASGAHLSSTSSVQASRHRVRAQQRTGDLSSSTQQSAGGRTRRLTPASRLKALQLLMDTEDPPVHSEPFCAAPATLKAIERQRQETAAGSMRTAGGDTSASSLTGVDKAAKQAERATKAASSTGLAALLQAKKQRQRDERAGPFADRSHQQRRPPTSQTPLPQVTPGVRSGSRRAATPSA